jgi:antitoxin (DNA-binding transcriptional repressor) of toxin-antitoxin stability system
MKTASVRVVQHRLSEVLSWVESGEEVEVTRRDKIVAKIVPAGNRGKPRIDFAARLKAIYPKDLPPSRSLSKLIAGERDER